MVLCFFSKYPLKYENNAHFAIPEIGKIRAGPKIAIPRATSSTVMPPLEYAQICGIFGWDLFRVYPFWEHCCMIGGKMQNCLLAGLPAKYYYYFT